MQRMRGVVLCPDADETEAEPVSMPTVDHGPASLVTDAAQVPTSSRYWEREVPSGDLVGWRVQVVYEYEQEGHGDEGDEGEEGGERGEEAGKTLQWAEGFVIAARRHAGNGSTQLHIFFPQDQFDDHFTVPDLDVAFHTPGASARAKPMQMRDAKALLGL